MMVRMGMMTISDD